MRGCDYFDYEPLSEDKWRNRLENSETTNYVFINPAIALSKVNDKYIIKHYRKNNVNTWVFEDSKECQEHLNELGQIHWNKYFGIDHAYTA